MKKEEFEYDPDTGVLKRRGKIARQYRINGRLIERTHIIWYLVYDRWPKLIDHINGKPWDNRLANLREADRSINALNPNNFLWRHNSSGTTGVYLNKRDNTWNAYINIDSRRWHLGCFPTKEEATDVRRKVEQFLVKRWETIGCHLPISRALIRTLIRS